jgi:hypothetical protein
VSSLYSRRGSDFSFVTAGNFAASCPVTFLERFGWPPVAIHPDDLPRLHAGARVRAATVRFVVASEP